MPADIVRFPLKQPPNAWNLHKLYAGEEPPNLQEMAQAYRDQTIEFKFLSGDDARRDYGQSPIVEIAWPNGTRGYLTQNDVKALAEIFIRFMLAMEDPPINVPRSE